jgi:hypothetical protein
VKILLWDEILKHITLPEGVELANVKRWTLTRMATQFQKIKQQLDKDYIKKNGTPNWIEYPKLKEHWTSFVEYKTSEDFSEASARAKEGARPSSWSRWICICSSQVAEDGRRPSRTRYHTSGL